MKNGKYTDKVEIVSSVKQLLCNSYSSTEILTLRPLTDNIHVLFSKVKTTSLYNTKCKNVALAEDSNDPAEVRLSSQ